MKFEFEVGEIEKHLVEFSHHQLAGRLLIQVDRKPVHRSVRLLNEPVTEVFRFKVGYMEQSEVRIEKVRKQLVGHRNSVYVDGRLAQVFVGA